MKRFEKISVIILFFSSIVVRASDVPCKHRFGSSVPVFTWATGGFVMAMIRKST